MTTIGNTAPAAGALAASRPRPYRLAGFDVELAGRRPQGRVLVVYLDRQGRRTDGYREVEPIALRRIGTHLADIKAAIAALPEVRLVWERVCPAPRAPGSAGRCEQPPGPATPRRRFVDYAIPAGDE